MDSLQVLELYMYVDCSMVEACMTMGTDSAHSCDHDLFGDLMISLGIVITENSLPSLSVVK